MREYPDLSQAAWDEALAQHANRYRIPAKITDEQALSHFSTIGRVALTSLAIRFANKSRESQKLPPIRVAASRWMPQSVSNWIESQVESVDAVSGHLGSGTYKALANAFLSELRRVEHLILGHRDP